MLESAARICEASNATIFLREGDFGVTRAQFGPMEGTPIGYRTPLSLGSMLGRSIPDDWRWKGGEHYRWREPGRGHGYWRGGAWVEIKSATLRNMP